MEISKNAYTVKAAQNAIKSGAKKSVTDWAMALNYALDRAETMTANDGEMPRGYNRAWHEAFDTAVRSVLNSENGRLDQFGSKAWAIVSHYCGQVFDDGFDRDDIVALATVMAAEYGGLSSAYSKLPKDEEGEKAPKGEKTVQELLLVAARRAKSQGVSAEDFVTLALEAFGA